MTCRSYLPAAIMFVASSVAVGSADDASDLRLVPFPKRVELQEGTFPLEGKLVLEVPAGAQGGIG